MPRSPMKFFRALVIFIIHMWLILFLSNASSFAEEDGGGTTLAKGLGPGGGTVNGSSGTVLPDLFSGTMSYTIPIEVPPGRKGMDPTLALTYRSSNGNGPLGMGWELELGAIERQTRNGVNYSGDDYVYRMAGATVDLIRISEDVTYVSKIEGAFTRFKKIGSYWEATDKTGTRYIFGEDADHRQDDATGIFKWCLQRVIDTNGNYMTLNYTKDQGQIYIDRIDYTYPGPTSYVRFYWESRTDAPVMYTTKFSVVTSKRLKAIDVWGNGNYVRAYQLSYTYSGSTNRSVLSSVQQFDKDSSVDLAGTVTGGTTLPAITFGAQNVPTGFQDDQAQWVNNSNTPYGSWASAPGRMRNADVDGDGRLDIVLGPDSSGNWYVLRSTGTSFYDDPAWRLTGKYGDWADKTDRIRNVDVDGDGRSDIVIGPNDAGKWYVLRSTGASFEDKEDTWTPNGTPYTTWTGASNRIWNVDVTGDGKADIVLGPDNTAGKIGNWYVLRSTGTSFEDQGAWISGKYASFYNTPDLIRPADVTGDGKADIVLGPNGSGEWFVLRSTGASFVEDQTWASGKYQRFSFYTGGLIRPGDVNGDGLTDIVLGPELILINPNHPVPIYILKWNVMLSTGTSFEDKGTWAFTGNMMYGYTNRVVDVNGDGKSDILIGPDSNGNWYVLRSTGLSFVDSGAWISNRYGAWYQSANRIRNADVDGEGKADIVIGPDNTQGNEGKWYVMRPNPGIPDLLTSVSNGLGGTTTVTYKPSNQYSTPQPQLPFPVQTVSEVKTNDGMDHDSIKQYDYSGGFYHTGEHDFRGFHNVKVTGPTGAITETWFHQGNDVAVDVNDPWASVGYMKGKPYKVKVSNPNGPVYFETRTTYLPDANGAAPWFNPPMEVVSCTGTSYPCASGKQTKVRYADATGASYYDSYGNLTQEDQYGDTGTSLDDRTVTRSFSYNDTPSVYIVGLPATEAIYSGIGTGGDKVSESRFYYDNVDNYTTAPTKGNLTRVNRWLDRPDSWLATTMTYDDTNGNLLSTTDPLAHTTSICYDASSTFPQSVTNPLSRMTKTEYYGVNWNTACGAAPPGYTGVGLYGQVKSVTDPNGGQTKTDYDTFGRKIQVGFPDGSWTSISYNNLGTVGAQHIYTNTTAGLTSRTYFDGLGRTIMEKKTGPDTKVSVVETVYNSTGMVYRSSLPYFEGIETAKYKTFTYDPLGRVTGATNPDTTVVTATYDKWSVTSVDAMFHQRSETRDAYGRLITVEEFTGTSPSATLYATTTYEYNALGNLKSVTDEKDNKTSMRYDSLGRKLAMSDPDMGGCWDLTTLGPNGSFPWYSAPCWNYEYDAGGNLIRQQDGKGQVIWFRYDAIGRLSQKDYGTQKSQGSGDVVYTYDSGTNGIGRLSQMSDLSGSSAYSYDVMGRTIQTDKIVGGTTYTTKTQYDSAGRVSAIAYPDNPTVYSIQYEYNGPVLKRVYEGAINHVQYSGHNGLGQPGTAAYGNGVTTTTYTYSNSGNSTCLQDNYRLCTQRTVHGGSPVYQDLRYSYDDVGNVDQITDNLDATNTETFTYDELNRLTSAEATVYGTIDYGYNEIGNMISNSQMGGIYTYPLNGIRPHAVQTAGGNSYSYDDNGNMTSGAGRQITYDYDNRPVSVTAGGVTTTFLYDGGGSRVRKTSSGVSTIYIGKLYENTPDGCVKYIFAGDQRIAMKDAAGALFYYHTDHLGSSSVVTDAAGNMVERLAYFPYGQTRINTGTKDVHHKFTGQELDAETGLYFYGARYYDPQLGRFISADTIVPDHRNPQDLNRYSYVSNNPLNYIDPTGHSWFSKAWHDVEDSISKTVRKANDWLGDFFQRNDINVNAGVGGTMNSGGHAEPIGYNPETGEIFPYMPSSVASVTNTTEYTLYAEAYEIGGSTDSTLVSARNPMLINKNITGVEIDFAPGADNPIDYILAEYFAKAVGVTKQENPGLTRLWISATTNGHKLPSLHVPGFAIDISRVNKIPIAVGYGRDPLVTSVVKSLQTNLSQVGAYENYGPYMMTGGRNPQAEHLIRMHEDHIHYSIKP